MATSQSNQVKINTDATFWDGEVVQVGVVGLDHDVNVLFITAKRYPVFGQWLLLRL